KNHQLQNRAAETSQRSDAGKIPAAKEQDHQQETRRHHVRVLADKKQAELQGAVFRVVAADQLLLRLRQIERQTVALGEHAREEQQKSERLIPDVPTPDPPVCLAV